jgi:hypothetical protein
VLDDPRADLDQALSERGKLAIGERVGPRDRGVRLVERFQYLEDRLLNRAHAMHQPERGGVENKPHLIGGRAVYASIERFQGVAATNSP